MESGNDERGWANMPPELLRDIIRRVESSETQWPGRKHVVACASVCSSWRDITREIVKSPELSNILTFPNSLKLPGPRENAIQCFIQRDKSNATYKLFLGNPPSPVEAGKFLMAAKKCRRATSTDYVISLVGDEFSRGSNYVGKIKSNFFGTRFTIYDTQAPVLCKKSPSAATNQMTNHMFASNKISPQINGVNYKVADITYELNVLGTRGPRRMHCTLHSIPVSSMKPGGSVPTHDNTLQINELVSNDSKQSTNLSYSIPVSSVSPAPSTLAPVTPPKPRTSAVVDCNSEAAEAQYVDEADENSIENSPLILKNKAPRWHEQLQCWCLNFRGRVTVASVKNFQLVAASEQLLLASAPGENDKVLLQFGKIGKDMFTMDYRYPLSAFQAFAICLSSFDNKLACE